MQNEHHRFNEAPASRWGNNSKGSCWVHLPGQTDRQTAGDPHLFRSNKLFLMFFFISPTSTSASASPATATTPSQFSSSSFSLFFFPARQRSAEPDRQVLKYFREKRKNSHKFHLVSSLWFWDFEPRCLNKPLIELLPIERERERDFIALPTSPSLRSVPSWANVCTQLLHAAAAYSSTSFFYPF